MDDIAMLYTSSAKVMRHVELSIQAEQVFCSIVTEMKFMPQFANDPNLATVHRENYETSYHRNTAAGNLQRLLALSGQPNEMLILMTVECFIETHEHDKIAEQALLNIKATRPDDEKWLAAAQKWHRRRKRQLGLAASTLRAAIGRELWEKGAALAE